MHILRSRSIVLLFTFTSILLTSLSASAQSAARRGVDPLDAREIDAAMNVPGMAVAGSRKASPGARAGSATGPATELLLVERRPVGKGAAAERRLADVYRYDYVNNELVHSVVDIEANRMLRRDRLTGVQLPLVPSEIERATEILMRSPFERARVDAAYRKVSGRALGAIDEIDYKAFVFHADSTLGPETEGAANCGINRCAQLLLYTLDNVSLDLSPIVDLTTGVVSAVLEPDLNAPQAGPPVRSYDDPLGRNRRGHRHVR